MRRRVRAAPFSWRLSVATHKFKIGETVELRSGRFDPNVPRGFYRIERLMPVESGNVYYRVKHIANGHERVVIENLISVPQPQDAMIGIPEMPRMSRNDGNLKWEARDASPTRKKARTTHPKKQGAG